MKQLVIPVMEVPNIEPQVYKNTLTIFERAVAETESLFMRSNELMQKINNAKFDAFEHVNGVRVDCSSA